MHRNLPGRSAARRYGAELREPHRFGLTRFARASVGSSVHCAVTMGRRVTAERSGFRTNGGGVLAGRRARLRALRFEAETRADS